MIRVAFTAPFPVESLGAAVSLRRRIKSHPASWVTILSKELSRVGTIDLHVVTTSSVVEKDQIIRQGDVTYHVIKSSLPLTSRSYGLASAYSLFLFPVMKMIRALKRIKPDLVHGHGTEGPYALAAVHSGFKNIVSMQGIINEIVKVEPSLEFKIVKHLELHALRKAMALNPKTQFSENFARTMTPETPRYLIEACIHDDYWKYPVPSASRNMYFVGSVIKRKGIEEWIRAFLLLAGKFPDLKGHIIGSGPEDYVKYLQNLINNESNGAGRNLEFKGQLRREEIALLFSKGGVFCLPSYMENSPNTIMEAMAAGLPVVASDVGDVRRMVAHRESGIVIDGVEVSDIADAIESLLKDEEGHFKAGQMGRSIASNRWKASICVGKHIEMYENLLSKS